MQTARETTVQDLRPRQRETETSRWIERLRHGSEKGRLGDGLSVCVSLEGTTLCIDVYLPRHISEAFWMIREEKPKG